VLNFSEEEEKKKLDFAYNSIYLTPMSMRRKRVQSSSNGIYIFCFIPFIHRIHFLSLSFILYSCRKKRSENLDALQGQVLFVRLGGRLFRIEFASYIGAILVQCIKCEGFFLSLFFLLAVHFFSSFLFTYMIIPQLCPISRSLIQ